MIDYKTPRILDPIKCSKKQLHIVVLLDSSASMIESQNQVIEGFNNYLNILKKDDNTEKLFTLIKFDTTCAPVSNKLPLYSVSPLSRESYNPNGASTSLYDSIGMTLNTLPDDPEFPILFVVITDGKENSSLSYDRSKIMVLQSIKQQSNKYTFVFLGANQDAFAEAAKLNINKNNVRSFGSKDFSFQLNDLGRHTVSYSQNVALKGITETTNFYSPEKTI